MKNSRENRLKLAVASANEMEVHELFDHAVLGLRLYYEKNDRDFQEEWEKMFEGDEAND